MASALKRTARRGWPVLMVLRLIAEALSNQEIADRLVVSASCTLNNVQQKCQGPPFGRSFCYENNWRLR